MFPGSLRVDLNDPAHAAIDMMRAMDRKAPGSLRNIKIKAVEYVPVEKGKAAFIRYSVTLNGTPTEAFGLYTVMPVDATQGTVVLLDRLREQEQLRQSASDDDGNVALLVAQ